MISIRHEFVFGTVQQQRIKGIPDGARYRLRFRNDDFARIFIKNAKGISEHYLIRGGDGFYPSPWSVGRNERGQA
jgi:hypothetical protein